MRNVDVRLHRDFAIGATNPRLFGAFVEHLGRCVYGGIFEPGHATADARGFRQDVLALVRELAPTIMRYPGGNFVSGYNWEDGIGPAAERPRRLDLAWMSTETNQFGTNEFIDWCRIAGTEPMLAVNLGTRGIDAARALVEYCNGAPGTVWADRRVANGVREPHGVRVWCLGNEMDGPWQIGAKDAVAYGKLAREAGKAMKLVDPSIELVACGSSNSAMPTFGAWEDTVLDLTWDVADHVSLHTYYDPEKYADADAYLACSLDLDRMISVVAATADAVAGRRRSRRRLSLSVDEWNVWHQTANPHSDPSRPFAPAPAIAEDTHTMADALVVGCLLITLLRHADRVRMACLAQLVNVIPPIRTVDGGPTWRQTTFFPFAHAARFGRGTVLRVEPSAPAYEAAGEGDVSVLAATAVASADGVALFAVNRAAEPLGLEARLCELPGARVAEHLVLDGDLSAANTAAEPDRVAPRVVPGAVVDGDALRVRLPPRSWNVIRLAA